MRRGGHNRLGFALQLCAFRYPGRLLVVGEAIPRNVLRFIAAQLGRRADSGLSVRFCPLPESTPRSQALCLDQDRRPDPFQRRPLLPTYFEYRTLALHMSTFALRYVQPDLPSYRESRVNLLFDEDIYPETAFDLDGE